MLKQFPAFIWMDASVRFLPCFPSFIESLQSKFSKSGIVMLHHSPHTFYSVTNPNLYKYLPTDIERYKTLKSFGGGAVLFGRNKDLVDSVIKWLALCSLEKNCAMPAGHSLTCTGAMGFNNRYMNCHRYDMAILGILLGNHFNFDQEAFSEKTENCFNVERHPSTYKIDKC